MTARPETIFLLSPATLAGARARQLVSPHATFETARRLRSPEGVPIGEAFAFLSSLYFRGKIAYARRFSAPESVLVIAPGFGLVPADWALTLERWRRMRRTPVDPREGRYARPLAAAAEALAGRLGEEKEGSAGRAVLLGSVATGKYVDLLRPALGARLLFPRCFAGLGDMSRGSLLLRAARSGEELAYAGLDEPRCRRDLQDRGERPPEP